MPSSTENDAFDPSSRRLCPDEACVGVLNAAGSCPVCGRRGQPATAGTDEATTAAEDLDEVRDVKLSSGASESSGASAFSESSEASAADGFDSQRGLCPDGTCLGVLGPEGRCNVCGRSAS